MDEPIAIGHARIVVNGSDGSTLDEVIEPAAVRVGGRQGRLNVGETQDEERERFQTDIAALSRRLDEIDDDIDREVHNLMARYKVRNIHWFPVAVETVVPLGEV